MIYCYYVSDLRTHSNLLSYDSLGFHTGIMPADAFGFEQIFLKYEQNSVRYQQDFKFVLMEVNMLGCNLLVLTCALFYAKRLAKQNFQLYG